MPKPLGDLTGQRFGRLMVVAEAKKHGRYPCWECVCDCGKSRRVLQKSLRSGNTVSCGCFKSEVDSVKGKANTKHGMFGSREHRSWASMKQRCLNPAHKDFHYYGGRGISVCPEWEDFSAFLRDMGKRPNGLSLDRINNDGNYEPGNCRWATPYQQTHNRRPRKGKSDEQGT